MSTPSERTRQYERRKAALERLRDRLRTEQRIWHQVWVRDQVPSKDVRDLIDELAELAGVNAE